MNEKQLEYLRIALDSCRQLNACINDLLDASRLDSGKLSLEVKPGSLAVLVKQLVASLQLAAATKKISLRQQAPPDLPDIPMDERRIIQVITNLINNALKFTHPGGEVTVKVGDAPSLPDYVCVSVRDTGCGIPSNELSRVFARLYQIKHGDATNEHGFGLGLYLCNELVRLHGGRIWAESELGKGSEFTFLLPKHPMVKLMSVLVVDDDPNVRELVKAVLERSDFVVLTADDGRAALQLAERRRPDAVVLDLNMPDVDGAEVLKQLRQRWGAIPVVVLTGFSNREMMHRALEAGPFTLLAKPCDPKELLAAVRRLNNPEESVVQNLTRRHRPGGGPSTVRNRARPISSQLRPQPQESKTTVLGIFLIFRSVPGSDFKTA